MRSRGLKMAALYSFLFSSIEASVTILFYSQFQLGFLRIAWFNKRLDFVIVDRQRRSVKVNGVT